MKKKGKKPPAIRWTFFRVEIVEIVEFFDIVDIVNTVDREEEEEERGAGEGGTIHEYCGMLRFCAI